MKVLTFALLALSLLLSACNISQASDVPPVSTQDRTAVVVAAEATVTAMFRQPVGTAVPQPTPTPHLVTSTPPTPSYDFWVTFLMNRKLAVLNGSSSHLSLLTNTPARDYLPTWSPDGNTLAFLRYDGASLQDGQLNILPLGADFPRSLDPASRYNYIQWLPDSRRIIATRGFSGAFEIVLLDVSIGAIQPIAKKVIEQPILSPDGTMIAYLVDTGLPCDGMGCLGSSDVFLYALLTGETRQLTDNPEPRINLSWAPDNGQIAFHHAEFTSNEVTILDPSGNVLAERQPAPWWTNPWLRSPDGSRIAYFASDSNGEASIYIVTNSSQPALLIGLDQTGDENHTIDTLRWRPDGSGLIFNSWIKVYTINLDGTGLRSLPIELENVLFDVRPSTSDYTPPLQPTPPASWPMCPGGLDTRLDIGRRARVSNDPPTPNNVRDSPNKNGRLVGQIQPGEEVEILDGPICDQGLTWWQVRSSKSGLQGYTLEGDQKTYWLVPVQ